MNRRRIIYWASSLHSDYCRNQNEDYADLLTAAGFKVLLPQRSGIWEQMIEAKLLNGLTQEQAVKEVKQECFEMDMLDMQQCDICVLYAEGVPSEGACFELGWCDGAGKRCVVFMPNRETQERTNLMITYSAPIVETYAELLEALG
jgi:nucleoside 2-deoxyribosyltransferase